MRKVSIMLAVLLCLSLAAAHAQAAPAELSLRYSLQISNGPTGTCGCFAMQGGAADLLWHIKPIPWLGVVADVGGEHTGNINNVGYGLTLTTFTGGPRIALPGKKVRPFAQVLLGVAHGSGSQFPQFGGLVPTANSFAAGFGVGADYSLNKRVSLRLPQLDFLHTDLPNNTDNKQNNFRVGFGITLHLGH